MERSIVIDTATTLEFAGGAQAFSESHRTVFCEAIVEAMTSQGSETPTVTIHGVYEIGEATVDSSRRLQADPTIGISYVITVAVEVRDRRPISTNR